MAENKQEITEEYLINAVKIGKKYLKVNYYDKMNEHINKYWMMFEKQIIGGIERDVKRGIWNFNLSVFDSLPYNVEPVLRTYCKNYLRENGFSDDMLNILKNKQEFLDLINCCIVYGKKINPVLSMIDLKCDIMDSNNTSLIYKIIPNEQIGVGHFFINCDVTKYTVEDCD